LREVAAARGRRESARRAVAGAATMAIRDVALPELRGTTGRDGALLGLPSIVDHLFDLHPLPARAGGGPRPTPPRFSPSPPVRGALGGAPGYCGLDSRRQPLTGMELRGCWEPKPEAAQVNILSKV